MQAGIETRAVTRTKMSGYQSSTSSGTGQECMVQSLNEESRSKSMGGDALRRTGSIYVGVEQEVVGGEEVEVDAHTVSTRGHCGDPNHN